MFTANGRAGKSQANKTKASIRSKEFVCSACGERKRLTNVEFGEVVPCECGNAMTETYAEQDSE